MSTYESLLEACNAKIPRDAISQRQGGNGKSLDYLAGWYVIDRLNKVFGQGNWSYTSEAQKLHEGTTTTKYGDTYTVHYSARVRLVVAVGDKPTEFTDYGYGDGSDKANIGKAHELAIKEAVTDGLKRAARCLGNSFGNGLYDKSGDGIDEDPTPTEAPKAPTAKAAPVAVVAASAPTPKAADARASINTLLENYRKIGLSKRLWDNTTIAESLVSRGVTGPEPKTDAEFKSAFAKLADTQASELLEKLKGMVTNGKN